MAGVMADQSDSLQVLVTPADRYILGEYIHGNQTSLFHGTLQ